MSKKNNKYKVTKAYSEFIKIQILIMLSLFGGLMLLGYSGQLGDWSIIVGTIIILACMPFMVLSYIRFGVDYTYMKKEYAARKYKENVLPKKQQKQQQQQQQQVANNAQQNNFNPNNFNQNPNNFN